MSAAQPEVLPDDCPLCHGAGEVSISVDGTRDGTDYYGCPICISRERDEDIKRLRALNADLLVALVALLPHVPGHMTNNLHGRPWIEQARAAIAKATAHKEGQ